MALALELDLLVATIANFRSTGFDTQVLTVNTILSYVFTAAYLIWAAFASIRIINLKKVYESLIYNPITETDPQLDTNAQKLKKSNTTFTESNFGKKFKKSSRISFEKFKTKHITYFKSQPVKFRRWVFVMSELSLITHTELLLPILVLIKDIILPVFFVSFLNYPYLQVALPMINCLVIIAVVKKVRPFSKKTKMNTIMILNEGTYFLTLLSFILIHVFRDKMTEKQIYDYFGWTLILLLCLVILINIAANVIEIIAIFQEWIAKMKYKRYRKRRAMRIKVVCLTKVNNFRENAEILKNEKSKSTKHKLALKVGSKKQ